MTEEEAKTLNERAYEYAQRNFPINENGEGKAVKNDIAFHGFCEGWNAALTLNPWRSVKEELPKNSEPVLVCTTNTIRSYTYIRCVDVARYDDYYKTWLCKEITYPEYWMPIPELPKEK